MAALKIVVLICAAILACQAAYSSRQSAELATQAPPCYTELNQEETKEFHKRAQTGDVTADDEHYKKYVACYMRNLKIVDTEGRIKKPELIEFLGEGRDPHQLRAVVDLCAEQNQGNTPDDRSFDFHRCFWTKKEFQM
ncbi:uncharacterized protein LOC129748429 [Uranotaenia lowii]|uniref:uncharacterized protein LOC129748429 n=1 Tax=Uranotaenia lowii TaxID=190385 RepID=UPI00247A6EE5|nr:uncharacterized protein LOC129748429 [Uranotaenia lowii]